MQIKKLYFGKPDGKDEATYKSDFEDFFFNYDDNYEKIQQDDKFLLLGRKGSGKSILAEYYYKMTLKSETPWFCDVVSYKDFNFAELSCFKEDVVAPNEYTEIWNWITLINISKKLLCDKSISTESEYIKLEEFFKINYSSIEIDAKKVVQITKKNEINGGLLKGVLSLGGGKSSESSLKTGTYLDFIEDLEDTVIELLKKTTNIFTIIFDELDDKFSNEQTYHSIIISLIKNTARINRKMFKNGAKCKVVLLLRTDILAIMNDADLNKVQTGNSVEINWGNSVDKYSPLLQMVYNKIRKSAYKNKPATDSQIYYEYFPDNINNRSFEEYLLGRTFFRPRDIISYLNIIALDKEYGSSEQFKWFHFTNKEEEYSRYFLREIKNEMHGHYEEKQITEMFKLLSQFKQREFTYDEIESYYTVNKERLFGNIDLAFTLETLFKFGVIGNKWYVSHRDKMFYSWNYRQEADVDFEKIFVVHLGLRKALGTID